MNAHRKKAQEAQSDCNAPLTRSNHPFAGGANLRKWPARDEVAPFVSLIGLRLFAPFCGERIDFATLSGTISPPRVGHAPRPVGTLPFMAVRRNAWSGLLADNPPVAGELKAGAHL